MSDVEKKWDEIIAKIKAEYCSFQVAYNTWIAPLKVYDVKDDVVYILVPVKASIEYIEKKYNLPFRVCIAEAIGKEYEVVFVTEEDIDKEKQHDIKESNKFKSLLESANLNHQYTFDSFVVGDNNNFAQAAALAVAEAPGEIYNPLFIYGQAGLGKTHLMQAIANHIIMRAPTKKVIYVTSETFTNELISALRKGSTGTGLEITRFREKYRDKDVLLIDDIQFIIGKVSTQEEFFHTFNQLYLSGKQIVISCDKPPKEIQALESRLCARFEWGLLADIQAPNYETRMAILYEKLDEKHLHQYQIPEDVLNYIATYVKTNIRELEGSLNKLLALANLQQKEIDIPLAAEVLKDIILPVRDREISPERILEVVAEHFSIPVTILKGKKRNANIVLSRQIMMYLCCDMTDATLESIGLALGGKHHTTISYGASKIKEAIEKDEMLANTVSIIRKKLTYR